MTTAISFGLGGPIVTDLAVVPELRLGQLIASDVEVRVERGGGFSQEVGAAGRIGASRSEEHTSELQSLMRISYAVFGLKKKNTARDYTLITSRNNSPNITSYTTCTTPLL